MNAGSLAEAIEDMVPEMTKGSVQSTFKISPSGKSARVVVRDDESDRRFMVMVSEVPE